MSSFSAFLLLAGLLLVATQSAAASKAHRSFFNELSDEQKEVVSKILHGGLSKAEIKEQLKQWVSTQPKNVQEAFEKAQKSLEERKQKVRARHMKLLSTASDETKALDQKIRKIYENQNLTKQQTCEKVNELIKKASAEAKKLLKLKERECAH